MEFLTLSLLKILASACLKCYLGYLLVAGGVLVNSQDLGYAIPSWFMNPGKQASAFYSYGTSVSGDEFESLEDARQIAVTQMTTLIRRSHQKIISEEVHYDPSSIKQQRLIELFLRGENLEAFILNHAVVDKKQLIKVKQPESDIRAFVRLKLKTEDYLAHQKSTLHDLRIQLTQQKSEDIMAEMAAEMQTLHDRAIAPNPDGEQNVPPNTPPAPIPLETITRPAITNREPTELPRPAPPAGNSVFDTLQSELDTIK